MMDSKKPGVYKNLDAWRGVAALWVVMFHVTIPIAAAHPGVRASLLYHASEYGAFGVWMFFVISGYCIAHAACQALTREHGLRHYVQARLRRIYPPCWASAVLYFAFAAVAALLVTHGRLKSSNLAAANVLHQHPLYFIANLTLTQKLLHQDLLQGVYWTLCYEVAFYVLVGLALAVMLRWACPRKLLTVLHGLTVSALLLLIVAPTHSFYPFDLWPYFGLGVLLYDLVRHPQRRTAYILSAVAGLEVLLYSSRHLHTSGYVDVGGGISLLFTLCFAILLLSLHRFDDRLTRLPLNKGLAWVGLFSYSLYLNHYIVISIISKIFEIKGKAGSWYDLCMIVSILASVAFARLFYQFFERPFVGSKRSVSHAKIHLANPVPPVNLPQEASIV